MTVDPEGLARLAEPEGGDKEGAMMAAIQELGEKLEAASGCPVDKQLLFYKHREVRPEMDGKTLLELNLHTGFALSGYDLREPPVFFPPVARTPDGLVIACPLTFPDGNPPDVIREGYP